MRPDALLAMALVAGCAAPSADLVARQAAKSAVAPVLAARFPGIPLAPATDCVIDNASAGEILSLANSAGGGPTPGAIRLVIDIATRPDTLDCLATDGLPVLLTAF